MCCVQVAVSGAHVSLVNPDLAEPLTLTPIEIQQMCLTEEQIQQIKAKKVKRIEKHGKIVKKVSCAGILNRNVNYNRKLKSWRVDGSFFDFLFKILLFCK